MMKYPIKRPAGSPTPRIFPTAARTGAPLKSFFVGQIVEIDNLDATQDWIEDAFPENMPHLKGWIERIYLDVDAATGVVPEEFTEAKTADFVLEIARQEFIAREQLSIDTHESAPPADSNYIVADYLIALARLETGLKRVETQLPQTDALGPFQITSQEWTDFIATAVGGAYLQSDRGGLLYQIPAANFLTLRDWAAMEALVPSATGENPFVPSFLDLYLSRLIGAKPALHLSEINANEDTKTRDLLEVIRETFDAQAGFDALLVQRAKVLQPSAGNAPFSVSGFVEMRSNKMAAELVAAFGMLKDHASDFVTLPITNETPWMAKAEEERVFWAYDSVTEESDSGKNRIVDDYFPATDYPTITAVEPWCGAFAAWCMKNSGNGAAAASIPKGAAAAANWKEWGTHPIRPGSIRQIKDDVLRGSVVVFRPTEGTNTSGHVAFAVKRAPTSDKIECISGNDGDTVRKRNYDISRIVAIRQLAAPTPIVGADPAITDRIVDFVKGWEGLELASYQDEGGVWTVGYGTTSRAGIDVPVGPTTIVTEPQAEEYLAKALSLFSQQITARFTRNPNPDQFGAMLSLAYNIGAGGFASSTALKQFNAGIDDQAAEAITMWKKVNGTVSAGLVARRDAEREWYLGNYQLRD